MDDSHLLNMTVRNVLTNVFSRTHFSFHCMSPYNLVTSGVLFKNHSQFMSK